MPMAWEQKGDEQDVPKGVHQAAFGYMEDKPETFAWSPLPRAFLKFELPELRTKVTCSVPCGNELAYVVWQMTGKNIIAGQTSSPDDVFIAARATLGLEGVAWNGQVRVNHRGWVDQLQVPAGAYSMKFGGFTTRGDDGAAQEMSYIDKKSGDERYFLRYIGEVIGTPWAGWRHEDFCPCSYKFGADGLLTIHESSALYKLLTVGGITAEEFMNITFDPGQSPVPVFEDSLLRHAGGGHTYTVVIDREGKADWKTLTDVGAGTVQAPVTATAPAIGVAPVTGSDGTGGDLAGVVTDLLATISMTMYKDHAPILEPSGMLNERGLYIAKNVLRPIAEQHPWTGIKAEWPPTKWGVDGMGHATSLLGTLAGKTTEELMMLVGEGEQQHQALKLMLASYSESEEQVF